MELHRDDSHANGQSQGWFYESADALPALNARCDFVRYLRDRATRQSDVEAAEIIYGELVSNVIRHAPGPICVGLDWGVEGVARLKVSDEGSGFHYLPVAAPDAYSEEGRGLFIVAALAQAVRVEKRDRGSSIAVALPVYLRTSGIATGESNPLG
jgi:anti-sigma regulatory factor (Ser/Thr protein kinase)